MWRESTSRYPLLDDPMMPERSALTERRQYPRRTFPLEGSWRSASGGSGGRIADISWGGCFVETAITPARGEHTELTILIGAEPVTIMGRVVAVFRGIGFSVRFEDRKSTRLNSSHLVI